MIIRPTINELIAIHQVHCGGSPLLDRPKLEGATAAPFASAGLRDAYQTLVAKAAKFVEAIAIAHAFLDGNKRLGWMTAVTFLEINRIELDLIDQTEIDDQVRALVEHDITRDQFELWLASQLT